MSSAAQTSAIVFSLFAVFCLCAIVLFVVSDRRKTKRRDELMKKLTFLARGDHALVERALRKTAVNGKIDPEAAVDYVHKHNRKKRAAR